MKCFRFFFRLSILCGLLFLPVAALAQAKVSSLPVGQTWVDLGVGPVTFQNAHPSEALIVTWRADAVAPGVSDPGYTVGAGILHAVNSTNRVWVRRASGTGTVILIQN